MGTRDRTTNSDDYSMRRPDIFRMVSEWSPHDRTWIAWPHRKEIWGTYLPAVREAFTRLIAIICEHEPVIVVADPSEYQDVHARLKILPHVAVQPIKIDDSWIRDNGPTFLVNASGHLSATIWKFNSWGEKYLPYADDAQLAQRISDNCGFPYRIAPIVCEGGAIQSDGAGTLLTTESVILNNNRNPGVSKSLATAILCEYTGVSHIIWLPEGLVGDETDGHIDNIACFAGENTILCHYSTDRSDENYEILRQNMAILENSKNASGEKINVIGIPLPTPVFYGQRRLTCSYLNYYFINDAIIVPTFGVDSDHTALEVFQTYFHSRKIIPFDSRIICIGGGGLHCIALNQPKP